MVLCSLYFELHALCQGHCWAPLPLFSAQGIVSELEVRNILGPGTELPSSLGAFLHDTCLISVRYAWQMH